MIPTGTGNVADAGNTANGTNGGTIDIASKEDVNLSGAALRATGDSSSNNKNRGGGTIHVLSHSGDVIWTNGVSTAPGVLRITGLSNVTINGLTGGAGTLIDGATFDSNASTSAFETVTGGTLDVGLPEIRPAAPRSP